MSRLFWLNDEQWSQIEPLLPHYGGPPPLMTGSVHAHLEIG